MNQQQTAGSIPLSPPAVPPWLLMPFVVTALMWLLTPYAPSSEPLILSFLIISVPIAAYVDWRQRSTRPVMPLLSMVGLMYWLDYCFAFFFGSRKLTGVQGLIRLNDDSLVESLAMVAAGVLLLAVGYVASPRVTPGRIPVIQHTPRASRYLCMMLTLGCMLTAVESSGQWLGESGRQIMMLMQSFIPMIAFAYLLDRVLGRVATLGEQRMVFAYGGLRVLSAVSSGWLGPLFGVVIVGLGVYVNRKRRMPVPALLVCTALFMFFQAGKNTFRNNYWYREQEVGKIERTLFWFGESAEQWRQALTNEDNTKLQEILASVLGRVSLLEQTANVMQLTPETVPYQEGASYSYMFISLIPRVLWPEKPSVNDANRAYQVAYGLTAERDLDRVSIAVGTLAEGYMNFGWSGMAGVMLGIGAFLRLFERLLLSERSGAFLTSVGLTLVPALLVVESQMAQYLSGLVQYIAAALTMFWPVLRFRKPEEEAAG